MSREPKSERVVALDLQNKLADVSAMQRYMRAPRSYTDPVEYAIPVQGYRGGGGPGWFLAQLLFVTLLFSGVGVLAFLYLSR